MGRPARTEEEDVDLSIFLTPEAWISLLTLIFLEIVLGVDNLVFISITTSLCAFCSFASRPTWCI